MAKSYKRGFTLIELLVVIAIIGILSSVVLASLNSARKKGRDARRIADVKQLQLALELYYDAFGEYPLVVSTTTVVSNGYISTVPKDPTNTVDYPYSPWAASTSADICSGYHLGTSLETTGHASLNSDADILTTPTGTSVCTGGNPDFSGDDGAKCATGDAGVACFDVKP